MEIEAQESIGDFLLAVTEPEVVSSSRSCCGVDLEGFGVFVLRLYGPVLRSGGLGFRCLNPVLGGFDSITLGLGMLLGNSGTIFTCQGPVGSEPVLDLGMLQSGCHIFSPSVLPNERVIFFPRLGGHLFLQLGLPLSGLIALVLGLRHLN